MRPDKRFYSFNIGIRGTEEQAEFWRQAFLDLIRKGVEASYVSFSFSAQSDDDIPEETDDDGD